MNAADGCLRVLTCPHQITTCSHYPESSAYPVFVISEANGAPPERRNLKASVCGATSNRLTSHVAQSPGTGLLARVGTGPGPLNRLTARAAAVD
jgi:hypothetical protein